MVQSTPLTPTEVADMLRVAPAMLQSELSALPARLFGWHPKAEEWCIKQVLGHLIYAEEVGFAGRIRLIIASEDQQLDASAPTEEALQRNDCERDVAELLEEFVLLRSESCALVADLGTVDLRRGGWHPAVGYMRVDDLLHEWVYHDRDHIMQIMSNIKAYIWYYLGSLQKFYQS
jgi:hypothetical protein